MVSTFSDTLKIVDNHGFYHQVNIEHHPEVGVSIAYLRGTRISQFKYGRWFLPRTDDDDEWEQFEDRFREGIGGDALSFFEVDCEDYINSQKY